MKMFPWWKKEKYILLYNIRLSTYSNTKPSWNVIYSCCQAGIVNGVIQYD